MTSRTGSRRQMRCSCALPGSTEDTSSRSRRQLPMPPPAAGPCCAVACKRTLHRLQCQTWQFKTASDCLAINTDPYSIEGRLPAASHHIPMRRPKCARPSLQLTCSEAHKAGHACRSTGGSQSSKKAKAGSSAMSGVREWCHSFDLTKPTPVQDITTRMVSVTVPDRHYALIFREHALLAHQNTANILH